MARDGNLPEAPYARNAFTSYSLNFEDVMLHRLFTGRGPGFYVDVGAGHPRWENDTCALHEAGWRGINVEPNETFFRALQDARPDDRNLCLALSDEVASEILYYEVLGTGLSTCDEALAQAHELRGHKVRLRRVPVSTLAHILDEAGAPAVDVLKVDVEGLEERVLAGNDWERFRPRVVLVEATFPESPERRPTGVRTFLETRGYRFGYFDGLNDFYLEQNFDDRGAFALPPNVFDGFTLRKIVDLCAAVESLQGEFHSAQSYATSLEAIRTAENAAHTALQGEFHSAQSYAMSLEAIRTAENAAHTALAAKHAVASRDAAALEAALTALLRGGHSLLFKRIGPHSRKAFLARFSGEDAMTAGQDPNMQEAASPILALRLAAAQIDGLETENRRLQLDLDDLRGENGRLHAAVGQMRAEILTLSRTLEPMHTLNEELAALRRQAERHMAEVGAIAERHRLEVERHRIHAEQLEQCLMAIYASSSWQLTRPWRALGRLLKRQRGGDWQPR
jgi:FkbM family methyltransferase